MSEPQPALFLDRDGVIINERGYVHRTEDIVLIQGAAQAIARVNALGVPVVVITNQAGIGRGLYTEADFYAVQAHLALLLASFDAHVDATYFCPHHPEHGLGAFRVICECRKPGPGLLVRAAQEMHLDLARSLMVGDKASDLLAGRAAGCGTLLVRTGYGAQVEADAEREPGELLWDNVFDSLGAAKDFLLTRFVEE